MVTANPGAESSEGMDTEDGCSAACWLCGHTFADDEPRRGAEVRSSDSSRPRYESVLVCLRCYHDFGVCPLGRRHTIRIETRLRGFPALHARAALLRGFRAEFAS